jgi:hypothetical protein
MRLCNRGNGTHDGQHTLLLAENAIPEERSAAQYFSCSLDLDASIPVYLCADSTSHSAAQFQEANTP